MDPENKAHDDRLQSIEGGQLERDLRQLYDREVPVPQGVDHRILDLARMRLSGRRGRRRWVLRWAVGSAAAAGLLVAVLLLWPYQQGRQEPGEVRQNYAGVPLREDIDHNGRVDILDAFAVARDLRDRREPDPRADLNHDGRIDSDDVTLIAQAAVSLSPGVYR